MQLEMAAQDTSPRLISLKHIKQAKPAPPPRVAWAGGKIVSNADSAVVKFLQKKVAAGEQLSEQQLAILQKFHSNILEKVEASPLVTSPNSAGSGAVSGSSNSASKSGGGAAGVHAGGQRPKSPWALDRPSGGGAGAGASSTSAAGSSFLIKRKSMDAGDASSSSSAGADVVGSAEKRHKRMGSGLIVTKSPSAAPSSSSKSEPKSASKQQHHAKDSKITAAAASAGKSKELSMADKLSMSLDDLAKLRR